MQTNKNQSSLQIGATFRGRLLWNSLNNYQDSLPS